jgi:AraC family transcriptional regulator
MCDQAAPIFQAIEFIESHLQEDINVAQIADAAGYSLFHFMRKFNQMVHHTPYDYLMRRRLTEAAEQLIHGNRRIIDIAQDYCFNDQETFSRVFRKMFQITPSQCRKDKGVSLQYLLRTRTLKELKFINSDHFAMPMVVNLCAMELYGLMTTLDAGISLQSDQRRRVREDFLSVGRFIENAEVFEIEYVFDPQKENRYYFVGVEKAFFYDGAPLLVSQIIGKGRYVKMEVSASDIQLASDYIHSTWIPRTGLSIKKDMAIICWPVVKKSLDWMKTILVPVENE